MHAASLKLPHHALFPFCRQSPLFLSLSHTDTCTYILVNIQKHATQQTGHKNIYNQPANMGGRGVICLPFTFFFFFVLDGQQQTCHPSIQRAHTHTNTQTLACMHANKHAINLHVSKSSKHHFSRCSIAREQLREQRAIQSREKEDDTHMFIQRNTERLHCSYTGLCSSSTRPSSHTCITHTHTQAR